MLQKNKGSILVVTVFVFFLVNIIAINCSALILSNTKYSQYDYEEMYLKEQCLSEIELIYSNILKEVDYAVKEKENYSDFQEYINSNDFLEKIKFVQEDDLKNTTCEIKKINSNSEGSIYYKITSKTTDNKFHKYMVASVEIKNPFKEADIEEEETDIEETENIKEESDEISKDLSQKEDKINEDAKNIKISDLVIMFDCKEV